MEIFSNVSASQLGVASGVSAHGGIGVFIAPRHRSALPTRLPIFGAGVACAAMQLRAWERPTVDAAAAVRTYAPTTIKRNVVAGVRPGLRSTSPPV